MQTKKVVPEVLTSGIAVLVPLVSPGQDMGWLVVSKAEQRRGFLTK